MLGIGLCKNAQLETEAYLPRNELSLAHSILTLADYFGFSL